jgi:PD-(D/E)XK endonuclease
MGCAFFCLRMGAGSGKMGKIRAFRSVGFKTYKERGEWVELRFMSEAMRHGYKVLKPWGDSQPFDVAINFGSRIVRVQVKSTSYRVGTGYRCEFEPNRRRPPYTLKELDFFAAYIIPQDAWYLIPAPVLMNGDHLKKGPMLFPMQPLKKNRYLYEGYREAWGLLRARPEESGRAANGHTPTQAEGRLEWAAGRNITALKWLLCGVYCGIDSTYGNRSNRAG